MSKQYWIGGFFIDLSRNQITQNKKSQTLAPKALAVLTYLAENHGKVVSQDALLAKVWPNTIVSPNTLQRSIAQLRKALGDDGKVQVYIKTHAKQGYSLECDVRWHDQLESSLLKPFQTNNEAQNNSNKEDPENHKINHEKNISRRNFFISFFVAVLTVFSILVYKNHQNQKNTPLTFDTLNSLTATDDKEVDPNYTPDGEYIVFHRYLNKFCVNKIWAKNTHTQREVQLTKDWGAYGMHSFSKDGKKMVFLATEACDQPITQKDCYDLVSLDFEKALKSPQEPELILQCQNSSVKLPKWLNNNDIAMLQRHFKRNKIIKYSVKDNTSKDLYEVKDGNIVDFTYSSKDDIIGVISIHSDDQYYIEILKTDGRILSSHLIERPEEIPQFRAIFPSFDPLNEQLIFSTGRQLFLLSYQGKITKINLPFAERAQAPVFHPEGKRVLLIKGPYDSDMLQVPLTHFNDANGLNETTQSDLGQYTFERSNHGEDFAAFQPNGDLIAFWSERSGEQQVWIKDTHDSYQLTHFPMDSYIRGMKWAADGQSLLVNVNGVLKQIFLDSTESAISLPHAIIWLYHWDSEDNSALVLIREQGIVKFYEYDLNRLEGREINDKIVLWAQKTADGRIIYKDQLDQFWKPGPVEDQRIDAISDQKQVSKSFLIKGNIIYAINKQYQLWSYDLDNDIFTIIGEVGQDVDYLTDVNEKHLLMTIRVAAKKEVVELINSQ